MGPPHPQFPPRPSCLPCSFISSLVLPLGVCVEDAKPPRHGRLVRISGGLVDAVGDAVTKDKVTHRTPFLLIFIIPFTFLSTVFLLLFSCLTVRRVCRGRGPSRHGGLVGVSGGLVNAVGYAVDE